MEKACDIAEQDRSMTKTIMIHQVFRCLCGQGLNTYTSYILASLMGISMVVCSWTLFRSYLWRDRQDGWLLMQVSLNIQCDLCYIFLGSQALATFVRTSCVYAYTYHAPGCHWQAATFLSNKARDTSCSFPFPSSSPLPSWLTLDLKVGLSVNKSG